MRKCRNGGEPGKEQPYRDQQDEVETSTLQLLGVLNYMPDSWLWPKNFLGGLWAGQRTRASGKGKWELNKVPPWEKLGLKYIQDLCQNWNPRWGFGWFMKEEPWLTAKVRVIIDSTWDHASCPEYFKSCTKTCPKSHGQQGVGIRNTAPCTWSTEQNSFHYLIHVMLLG